MEGLLYKWAGYLAGWNEKFCVLRDGILSVFESQDDHNNGQPSSDSLSIGLCEIVIIDDLQWELRGAKSKIWFLKAQSSTEKQKWVKAIGTSKACLLGTPMLSHLPAFDSHSVSSYTSGVEDSEVLSQTVSTLSIATQDIKELSAEDENLVEKCDDAVIAINALKESTIHICSEAEKYSVMRRVEISLRDLLKLAETEQSLCQSLEHLSDQLADSSLEKPSDIPVDHNLVEETNQVTSEPTTEETLPAELEVSVQDTNQISLETFFSTAPVSFKEVRTQMKEELIPIQIFLEACAIFADLLDRLAGSLLSPLRSDVLSNAQKIRKAKSNVAPTAVYLQDLIEAEVKAKQYTGADTGTQALLWLHRSLLVMAAFFFNVFQPDSPSFKVNPPSFQRAYEEFLGMHHNWMVQRLFKMGLKMLPDFPTFLGNMANDDSLAKVKQSNPMWEAVLFQVVSQHCLTYAEDLKYVAMILRNVFVSLKLKP